MQFIKQENSFLPAFFVWSIGKVTGKLVPNKISSGLNEELQSSPMSFRLIFPMLLLGIKLFEFKFYR